MWCTTPTSTCSSSATRKSVARNGISAVRSKCGAPRRRLPRRSSAARPAAGIDDSPTEVGPLGGHHHLPGDALGRHEQRAQALMARHHVGQRGAQRVDIQPAAQPQRHRHVVNRRRPLQLVQEPQPRSGRTTTAPPPAARPATSGSSRPSPAPIRGANWATVGASNRARTARSASRRGVDRGDHPHRRQRVPAEVEERVVDPDPLDDRGPGRRCRPGSPRRRLAGAR